MSDPHDQPGSQRPPYDGGPPGRPHITPPPGGPPGQAGPPVYGQPTGPPQRKTLPRWGVLSLGIGGGFVALGAASLFVYAVITAEPSQQTGPSAEPSAPPSFEQSPYEFDGEVPDTEIPDIEIPEIPEGTTEEQAEQIDVTATHGGPAGDTVDPNAVYTVVDLEVENGSSEPYSVDSLFLEVVLADGSSVSAVEGTEDADIDRLSPEDIPPGESITGQVAVVGEVQPAQVEFNHLFGDTTIVVDVE